MAIGYIIIASELFAFLFQTGRLRQRMFAIAEQCAIAEQKIENGRRGLNCEIIKTIAGFHWELGQRGNMREGRLTLSSCGAGDDC